jgi:uncharacterized OB-fold protein
MSAASRRPLPVPTARSAAHWTAARNGELLVQRCATCGRFVFIPAPCCPYCFGGQLDWVRSSGRGEVHTFTIVWRAQVPAFEVPYVVAIIEVEEGWHMLSNIVDCPVEQVRIGMPVQVAFERASDEITLPVFRPRCAG